MQKVSNFSIYIDLYVEKKQAQHQERIDWAEQDL
jgi:hypothetical protein